MDSDDVEFTAEKVAKFKEYMSNEKRDMSYLMAFGTEGGYGWDNWEIDDVHVSEDLLSLGTLEMIDMFFSKRADVMFVWRIDRKDITGIEAKTIHDYVVHNMEDFMSEGEGDERKSIHRYLILTPRGTRECLVLIYDKSAFEYVEGVPREYYLTSGYWWNSANYVFDIAVKRARKIASGDEPYHDDLMDVMTGKKQSGQQFDDLDKRRKI